MTNVLNMEGQAEEVTLRILASILPHYKAEYKVRPPTLGEQRGSYSLQVGRIYIGEMGGIS